jgi:Cu+-exporting ATPase
VASFSPACDVILEASMLGKLASFLKFSKQSVNVIKACYAISLIYNLVGITITVQGKLSPVFTAILMPLSSITIMLFTTGLVSYVAYKLFNLNKNALWKF